jgi:hypothetical protein
MHNKHESQVCLPMHSGQADPARPARSLAGLVTRSATFSASDRVSPNASADGHRKASSVWQLTHGTQQEVFGTARQCPLFRQEEVVTEFDDQTPQAVLQQHSCEGRSKQV